MHRLSRVAISTSSSSAPYNYLCMWLPCVYAVLIYICVSPLLPTLPESICLPFDIHGIFTKRYIFPSAVTFWLLFYPSAWDRFVSSYCTSEVYIEPRLHVAITRWWKWRSPVPPPPEPYIRHHETIACAAIPFCDNFQRATHIPARLLSAPPALGRCCTSIWLVFVSSYFTPGTL